MKTQHTITATWVQAIYNKVDVEITYAVIWSDAGLTDDDEPTDDDTVEFVSARYVLNHDAYSDMECRFLDVWAETWLDDSADDAITRAIEDELATEDDARDEARREDR